jgi:hypothetical protein
MGSIRRSGLRRTRSVVALCRARLFATRAGRLGRTFAALCAVGFAVVAIALHVADGAEALASGLTFTAAQWLAWVAGGALAYAAAEDHAAVDRSEGVEALVAGRGLSTTALASARMLAAMSAVAWVIGSPLALLVLLTAALAGSVPAVIHRVGAGLGAIVFAVVAGVTLGGVGSACGGVGRARGRWLLLAVVAGPWVLADLAGHGAWSIPGALGAVLDFVLSDRSFGA